MSNSAPPSPPPRRDRPTSTPSSASSGGAPAGSPAWRTAARAASPTCCAPSPGCPTARPSRRRTTPPAPGSPARSSTLETAGVMREMTERLGPRRGARGGLRAGARALPARSVPSSATCPRSTGSPRAACPTRVKCLHVLVGHSLAAGPGVNPLGDEALAMLDEWWRRRRARPCTLPRTPQPPVRPGRRPMSDPTSTETFASARSTAAPTRSACSSPTSTPATGALTDVLRRMEIVRLGHGVDRTGVIAPEAHGAHARLAARVRRGQCRSSASPRVRFVATSASRDAAQRRRVRRRRAHGLHRHFGDRARGRHRRRGGRAVVRRRDRWPARARHRRPVPRRRPRRRLDRAGPRHRPTSRPPARSTSAACG